MFQVYYTNVDIYLTETERYVEQKFQFLISWQFC